MNNIIFHPLQVKGREIAARIEKFRKRWPWFEIKYVIQKNWSNFTWYFRTPVNFVRKVWWFRKELWNFGRWDFGHNLALLERSLELSAEFYESDKPCTADAKETAAQIREFLKDMKVYRDPYAEAERLLGFKLDNEFIKLPWDEREKNSVLKLREKTFFAEVDRLEKKHWKKAWRDFSDKAQGWWD